LVICNSVWHKAEQVGGAPAFNDVVEGGDHIAGAAEGSASSCICHLANRTLDSVNVLLHGGKVAAARRAARGAGRVGTRLRARCRSRRIHSPRIDLNACVLEISAHAPALQLRSIDGEESDLRFIQRFLGTKGVAVDLLAALVSAYGSVCPVGEHVIAGDPDEILVSRNGGEVARQAGNNHPTTVPTGVFKTRDGLVNIATTGGKMWERFCATLGAEALTKNPDYRTAQARSKNRDALNAEIESYLQGRTSAEWVEHFNNAGVPCGPIYSIDQVFADPQVRHLGIAQSVTGKDMRALRLVGQPVSLSRTPSRLKAPPPKFGEHTDAVLKEFGFSAREIAALHKAKAV